MPIKTGDYIFDVFPKVRGCVCRKCGEKRLTLSFRFYRPREGRLRICYRCLAEFYLSVLEGNKMEVKTEDLENTKPFEKPPEPKPDTPEETVTPSPKREPRKVIATIAGAEVIAVPEPIEEPSMIPDEVFEAAENISKVVAKSVADVTEPGTSDPYAPGAPYHHHLQEANDKVAEDHEKGKKVIDAMKKGAVLVPKKKKTKKRRAKKT